MINFIMIAFCIMTGMIMKSARLIHPDAHKGINTWILYIALPAVSFKYLPKVTWSPAMILPVLSAVVVVAGSWCFMNIYCRYKQYSKRTHATLELAGGYSNTSFIGFPLIIAYFGEQYISIAIICDQMTFLILSTIGIITALKGGASGNSPVSAGFLLKKLLTFPPFLGCVLALLLSRVTDLSVAEPFFDKLVATVAPLALFSIGLQLKFSGWRKEISQVSVVLLYKLLLAPALVVVAALLLKERSDIARISIFEAAMPTLVTSGVIAEQFRLNTRVINLIIGISILVSFLTTAAWFEILKHVF
ncbi:AEC family transporter [Chitinophaga ginsengisegetis]|uniref:AEC family transporter n=1 Tax=Chitinophaga ginsengisegetis TaxID=393003 RepID=UPI000DB9641A|nr:AEC family transporter [Chitinophaga ginsengisegetis]